ncbi:hypothetical protein [Butyrivibrio sp. FCS014]|uniref:hypothetical protein n=1 Tax=Butyrivibrio sp. FCS014 TaxID=1408304 RepID=UPI0004675AAF|nr:hypothetical protein [Butyrivibrio sp. FCS014]
MKKSLVLSILVMMTAVLVACGPSDEKMAEVTQAMGLMTGAGEAARETFLDITDSSMKAQLDELLEKENEIKAIELEKLNDKKIDEEVMPRIEEVTRGYQDLDAKLSEILTAETATKTEKDKHRFSQVYFINKTGMNLTEIKLHDITQDTYSDNFLGDGVTLEAGYTLMGPALDVYADSSRWEFVIKSDADTEYTLSCESLLPVKAEGLSITLSYDSKTEEGTADFGGYTAALQEPSDEATQDASGEGASAEISGEDAESDEAKEASSN